MADIQELERLLKESRAQIELLSKVVDGLEAEVSSLKKSEVASASVSSGTPVQSAAPVQPAAPVQSAAPVQPANSPYRQNMEQSRPQQPQSQPQPQPGYWARPENQHRNLPHPFSGGNGSVYRPNVDLSRPAPVKPKLDISAENFLGKNIMGIAASILIFISFILFATLVIPALTDGIKLILMLAVSIGITAVGLIKWFPKKESVFFLSLGACGVGAIYISLFLCHAYFHIFGAIVLYVLILGWEIGVLFLSRYKQRVFEIIGDLGILVSVCFGVYNCVKSEDGIMLLVLVVYFIVGIVTYMAFTFKDNISMLIHNIASVLCSFLILIGVGMVVDKYKEFDVYLLPTEYYVMLILVGVFAISMLVIVLMKTDEHSWTSGPIFGMLYNILIGSVVSLTFGPCTTKNVMLLIVSAIIYVGVEYFKKVKAKLYSENEHILFYVWESGLVISMMLVCLLMEDMIKYSGLMILILPLAIYGYTQDDKLARIMTAILYFIQTFMIVAMDPVAYLGCMFIGYFAVIMMMYFIKNQYSSLDKLIGYWLFFLSVFAGVGELISTYGFDTANAMTVTVLIMGIVNIFACKTVFSRSWLTDEDEEPVKISTYIINACLMLFILILMFKTDDAIYHFLAIVTAVGLFSVNTAMQIKKNIAMMSLYVAVKYTILLVCVCSSYSAPNYLLSVLSFVLAIVFIVLGFTLEQKSMRIYGLVLSMICVIKLVMIDITYDNTLGHAISFFISGVLCFAISAVYSIAEKKIQSPPHNP